MDPNILDLEYDAFKQLELILSNHSTLASFLEVLPPDCSSEKVLASMEIEGMKYNMTPAKSLLMFLGSKGFRASDLIKWFQAMGLEKALTVIKDDEALMIISQPPKEVKLKEGSELTLTCSATSYPPPEYQWYKDDMDILCEIDPNLIIKPVRIEDGGCYTCRVTKWNTKKNAYDWLYSDFSFVEVFPDDLHAISSCNQEPHSSIHNTVCIPQTVSSTEQDIIIIKHPYIGGKIAPGMSVCLSCEAVSSTNSLNYQWFKNRKPLSGEVSSQLILNDLYPDPDTGEKKWIYQCEVYNEFDRALSEIAVVELDETNDTTPYVAHQKYAFMVANDTYEHLENLQKPAADVKDLGNLLSSLGFKISAYRNLTLTEMRNAFAFFCKNLIPGCYALFFFAGHGFELYGQTYLQTVDSSEGCMLSESVCLEYILQCMQERKPALNVLLIDACRKLPSNRNPGRIFKAKMKNNTVFGYSTSFLYASHESDEEANSLFVKHLKKRIVLDKSIEDILWMVRSDFAHDPVAKAVQFPVIKSSLTEKRKLSDPIHNNSICIVQSDILNWCDIKREIMAIPHKIPSLKAAIVIEFHHHMEIFCNGMDVCVFLDLEPNANMIILNDMEINISFISPVFDVKPKDGMALRNANLSVGRRNLLFIKEVFHLQRSEIEDIKYNISLKFCSKNVVQNITHCAKLIKISELKLSLNRLNESNFEESLLHQNQVTLPNLK